jgi:putative ABC transport system ATP-binding protein
MIQVKHLSKVFGHGDTQVNAIKDINFIVETGSFASIIGKSGSGKSTLMSLLGALDSPTEGEVLVEGKDITKLNGRALTKYRAKDIGFVFQGYNLIPNLTALENVMLAMEFAGTANRTTRASELLNKVGIEGDKQHRKPGKLSGGEQQRVAIARALANQPKLILADEPTGNLDSQNGKMIFDLLYNLARTEKTTIIAVTHDLEIAGKTDKTFTLSDGHLEGRGNNKSVAEKLGIKK